MTAATNILILGRSLLEDGWCRDALARNDHGNEVLPTSLHAVAWCAYGALFATECRMSYVDLPAVHRLEAIHRLEAAIGGEDLATFNNRQESVEPVLAAFDRAIAGEPAARIAGETTR